MNFKGWGSVPNGPGAAAANLLKVAILGGAGLCNGEGGHRAIGFNRIYGIKDKVCPEGTHLMVPWLERPIIYDVRAWPQLVESTSISANGTPLMPYGLTFHYFWIKIGLRVLTWPFADCLATIYLTLGENYNETVLSSIIHETEICGGTIQCQPADHTKGGTEAKQVAAQEAEQAKFIVEKAEQDKKCAIIRAQGARLIGQAIAKNPAFLALRRIEAATEVALQTERC